MMLLHTLSIFTSISNAHKEGGHWSREADGL